MSDSICPARRRIHATAVVVGERGLLIRGDSGAGKSALALALLACDAPDRQTRLVADDRVEIEVCAGRLIARPHPAIVGLIEQRGVGLLPAPFETAAVVRAVVNLQAKIGRDIPSRFPEEEQMIDSIAGVSLPQLTFPKGISPDEGARRVISFLAGV